MATASPTRSATVHSHAAAGRLPFLGIAETVAETLAAADWPEAAALDELVEADAEARRLAAGAAAPA